MYMFIVDLCCVRSLYCVAVIYILIRNSDVCNK